MLSVIISLAVARTLGATANSRALRAAESVAVDSLTALGSTDYGTLIEGNFPVPNPCDENNATGINATTCVDVGNIPVEIGYSYQTMDVNGVATCSNTLSNGTATATKYAFVGLCANIKTIGGSEAPEDIITPTRHINSPSPEYAPDGGVVRVAITGDYSNLLTGNSLYLVRANNPSSLVGTGAVDPTTGMAYIATVGYTGTGSGEPKDRKSVV